MTVLFVINSLKTGGKERRMLELVKSLKTRYAVHCIIFALNDEVQQSQVHDFGIKLITCKKSFLSRAKAIYTIMRICVEDKPDIINSWCSLSTIISIPGKVLFHKPLVNNQITSAHLEHKRISLGNLVNRINFQFSDLIIANSDAGLKIHNPPVRKSVYIHNGFDLDRTTDIKPSIETIRARFAVKTPILLTMIGSMKGKKDYDTFLGAAIAVCRKHPEVTFMGVGGGQYHQIFSNKVPDELRERILFPGERHDVDEIVYASDIGVMATYSEGISNVLMEFMAFSKPVVTTRVGGTLELVRDGIDGLLVEPQSERELTEKIESLIDNPDRTISMGLSGKERIVSDFNMDKQVSRYYEHLLRILS